jgi:diguanylate cyclase (GGDEF)-like protein
MNISHLEQWLMQAVTAAIAPTELIATVLRSLQEMGIEAALWIAPDPAQPDRVLAWATPKLAHWIDDSPQGRSQPDAAPPAMSPYASGVTTWPPVAPYDANTGDYTVALAEDVNSPTEAGRRLLLLHFLADAPEDRPPDLGAALTALARQIYLTYHALAQRHAIAQLRRCGALVSGVSQLLNSSLEPDQVIDRVMAELGQTLESDRVLLLDFRKAGVDLVSQWPQTGDDDLWVPVWPAWEEAVDALEQGGASYLSFGAAGEDSPLDAWIEQWGATTLLLVPVFVHEELFGAIALLTSAAHPGYSIDQLQALRQVTNQIAIALLHTQNYLGLRHEGTPLSPPVERVPLEERQDPLTQRPTRPCLEQELAHLSNRTMWTVNPPFSLVLCDLDYFKLVNDAHGYGVGDEVLRQVAERLGKQLRQGTPFYRYGGEEFAILLPETPLPAAMGVAERLRWAIGATPIKTTAGPLTVTASFGVAQQAALHDANAMAVLDRATQALALAKYQGRNCVMGSQIHPNDEPRADSSTPHA